MSYYNKKAGIPGYMSKFPTQDIFRHKMGKSEEFLPVFMDVAESNAVTFYLMFSYCSNLIIVYLKTQFI